MTPRHGYAEWVQIIEELSPGNHALSGCQNQKKPVELT